MFLANLQTSAVAIFLLLTTSSGYAGAWDYPIFAADFTTVPQGPNHDRIEELRKALLDADSRHDHAAAIRYARQIQALSPLDLLALFEIGPPKIPTDQTQAAGAAAVQSAPNTSNVTVDSRFADFSEATSQSIDLAGQTTTEWKGVTTSGIPFSYFKDGSGSIGPGLMGTWGIGCITDQMTDVRTCRATSYTIGLMISFTADKPTSLCAFNHDFPGRTAMFRVGKDAPIEANFNGGCLIGPAAINFIGKLAPGVTVRTRSVEWPYDFPKDSAGTLDATYPEMLRMVGFLYSAHL